MIRHGVQLPGGSYERAFDEGMRPSTPVNPGSFATPLALMTSATGGDRIDAAFAFGILAGHSGRAASPQELAAAGQALAQMIASEDRRTRIAGARVTGRIFAVPFEARSSAVTTPGLADALFALFNRPSEIEQLAAMDALGLLRQVERGRLAHRALPVSIARAISARWPAARSRRWRGSATPRRTRSSRS